MRTDFKNQKFELTKIEAGKLTALAILINCLTWSMYKFFNFRYPNDHHVCWTKKRMFQIV